MQDIDADQDETRRLEAAVADTVDPASRALARLDLARRCRHAGEPDRALAQYAAVAADGAGDPDLRWAALYGLAQTLESQGRDVDEVLAAYLAAADAAPGRAEPLHGASRFCRFRDRFAEGYELATRGVAIPRPSGGRFVEEWIYDFGLLDELAVHAYWSGDFQACFEACRRLLREGKMPRDMRPRIVHNRDAALYRLREAAAQRPAPAAPAYPVSDWLPEGAQGGTEIMIEGLAGRLASELQAIDLQVNGFDPQALTGRPLVVWFHHDIDQAAVQWCRDAALTERVRVFVFVSYWQRDRYIEAFGLPPDRCTVLRNATETPDGVRAWRPGAVRRVAYISTPFRGLDVLLDAWDRLRPEDAELHIWSSWRLYGMEDDAEARGLFERARLLPRVHHRGILPNAALRRELREVDFLAYPSKFAETSCLSVIEAMAAGCRVICSALGALPETTAGFARLYPRHTDANAHAEVFAAILDDELATPWAGRVELSAAQQDYCRTFYDWSGRVAEWRALLAGVAAG